MCLPFGLILGLRLLKVQQGGYKNYPLSNMHLQKKASLEAQRTLFAFYVVLIIDFKNQTHSQA